MGGWGGVRYSRGRLASLNPRPQTLNPGLEAGFVVSI